MADRFGGEVFLWEILILAIVAVPGLLYLYKKDKINCDEKAMDGFLAVNIFVIGAALSTIFRLVFMAFGGAGYEEATSALFTGNWMLQTVVLLVASPLLEELLFRGVFLSWLRKHVSGGGAIVISALCFGLYHGNVSQGIYGLFMGILLAMAMERHRTITAPVAMHIGANAAALVFELVKLL